MSNNNGTTGERKTILFNTSSLHSSGLNKTKKRKEKKVKPVIPLKPNALKKKLLEKIKQHQVEERIKNNPNRNHKNNNKGKQHDEQHLNQGRLNETEDYGDKPFHNNFNKSLLSTGS